MKQILYIDDNSQARLLLKLFLEKEGFKVFSAGNTEMARKILKEHQISCIITDVGLPGENGLEFYHWIQEQDAYKQILFLFVSGHAVGFNNDLSIHRSNFITKPIFFPDLIDRLHKELTD